MLMTQFAIKKTPVAQYNSVNDTEGKTFDFRNSESCSNELQYMVFQMVFT